MTAAGPIERSAFPALQRSVNGKPIVYLDSAATSLKPRVVLDAERALLEAGAGNIHRGKHLLSEEASEAYEQARVVVSEAIGASASHEVVFVRNTTEAINLVADGLELGPDDEVLVPITEHHSNILPWQRRCRVTWLRTEPGVPLSPQQVADAIGPRTRLLAVAQASNVNGLIQPIAELCRPARERGVLTLVDAAQSIAHLPIDVRALGCDFLAFSGHKAYGPTGIGVLYGRESALERLRPSLLGGGTVVEVRLDGFKLRGLPQRLEAGTPHISGVVGLAAALRWAADQGRERLHAHGQRLAGLLVDGLKTLRGVRLVDAPAAPALPLATMVLDGVSLSADAVAQALSDRFGVMMRSGFMCAHPLFQVRGHTEPGLRASCGAYTTQLEVEQLVVQLDAVISRFRRP